MNKTQTIKKKDIEEPKDLNVKIGTPEQVAWQNIKDNTEIKIADLKEQLMFWEAVLEMTDFKIEAEKLKYIQ